MTPAFGPPQIITQQILLTISFNNHTIKEWFYLLSNKKNKIILGKPLLKKLNYKLTPNRECISINGNKLDISQFENITKKRNLFKITKTDLKDKLKHQFPDIFSQAVTTKPLHNYQAKLTLIDFPYTKPKAYFTTGSNKEAIRTYIQQSLENGLIKTIESDELVAMSPIFALPQKNGKIRIITDLRKINRHLQYTPRPIPPTASILPELSQKTIFSVVDIRKAYQQIPLKGHKLGLITQFGSYKFTRLPYGLAAAPYWWGEFIDKIISTIDLPKGTIVKYYYDDIIIASEEKKEHIQILYKLFDTLNKNGLSISEEKLQLATTIIEFLGYELSYNRIAIQQEKKDTIKRWVQPTSKEGIIKFIGFTNFLRQFIPETSRLLKPFYEIAKIKKNTDGEDSNKAHLAQQATKSFNEIKQLITRSLTLKIFDPQQRCVIYSDASLEGASAVLFQPEYNEGREQLYPIAFYSVCFNETQKRYATVERELWAVINTLDKAQLVLSPNITIFTDNQGIISIGRAERATHPRLLKYLDVLSGYRLTWKYLPGIKNTLADYLSRFGLHNQPILDIVKWNKQATDINLETNSLNEEITDIDDPEDTENPPETQQLEQPGAFYNEEHNPITDPEKPTNESNNDIEEEPIEETLEEQRDTETVLKDTNNLQWSEILEIKQIMLEKKTVPQKFTDIIDHFTCVKEVLYLIRDKQLYAVITDADYFQIAENKHNKYHCTHRVLHQMIQDEKFWNPNSSLINLDIVRNCAKCEIYQRFNELPVELPQIRKVAVFSRWHFDYAGPLPNDRGYKHILVAVDYTSNIVMVVPTPAQKTLTVVQLILMICSIFGSPNELTTDNGSVFLAEILPVVATQVGIKYNHSSAYNPRGNSKAERTIRMLKEALKKLCNKELRSWSTYIYQAADIVNSTQLIYGYAPRQIAYGLPPAIRKKDFAEILQKYFIAKEPGIQIQELENVHLAMNDQNNLEEYRNKAMQQKEKIREALRRTRQGKDAHMVYTRGELVYRWRPKKNKHEPTWDGPYHIKDVVGINTYRLQDMNGNVRKALYNGTKLKPAYSYYGSPIRTAAEYTRVYNDKERKYYIQTLKDLVTQV